MVPGYDVGLFNSLHGSSQGSEDFDLFNTVFIGMCNRLEDKLHIYFSIIKLEGRYRAAR